MNDSVATTITAPLISKVVVPVAWLSLGVLLGLYLGRNKK